jgi:hypothetical protein
MTQEELIEHAKTRARQMYPAKVSAALVDQLTALWSLRGSSPTFRADAIALAEDIVTSVNYSDPDALARVIEEAMQVQDPERSLARIIADYIWQFDKRAVRDARMRGRDSAELRRERASVEIT